MALRTHFHDARSEESGRGTGSRNELGLKYESDSTGSPCQSVSVTSFSQAESLAREAMSFRYRGGALAKAGSGWSVSLLSELKVFCLS